MTKPITGAVTEMMETMERVGTMNAVVKTLTACLQCGTCSASCVSKSSFNLRKIVMDFVLDGKDFDSSIWDCTTCFACQTRCPREIPLTDVIVDSRRKLVESGRTPPEVRDIFISIQKFRNPFGVPSQERKSWLRKLKVEKGIPDISDGVEYFWFIGCFNSVDPRSRMVVEKVADIFNEIGINYGISESEGCCGNDVYAMGEEGLFELLKEENTKFLRENGIRKIITTSPHCYNAFKNYYSSLQVYTPVDIVHSAILDEELKFKYDVTYSVTYHDPCFLGRYNGVYEKPREVLKAIYNIEIIEMQRTRENSFCCGGGSGNFMRTGSKPNVQRAKEAIRTSAEILAVSCPLCMNMLNDGVKSLNSEMKVMDVMELIHKAVFGEK
jgi:Fe-S oxidoreductase